MTVATLARLICLVNYARFSDFQSDGWSLAVFLLLVTRLARRRTRSSCAIAVLLPLPHTDILDNRSHGVGWRNGKDDAMPWYSMSDQNDIINFLGNNRCLTVPTEIITEANNKNIERCYMLQRNAVDYQWELVIGVQLSFAICYILAETELKDRPLLTDQEQIRSSIATPRLHLLVLFYCRKQ